MRSIRNFTAQGPTERRTQPIHDIFADVEHLLRPLARENATALAIDVHPGDLAAWCDKTLIEQVVLNLALNALQAMSDTDRSARRIGITASASNADFIEIAVSDHGRGMTEGQIQALFHSRRTTQDGFGFGLILSRSIIVDHGGEMWARSTPGSGTSVFFTLHRRR